MRSDTTQTHSNGLSCENCRVYHRVIRKVGAALRLGHFSLNAIAEMARREGEAAKRTE